MTGPTVEARAHDDAIPTRRCCGGRSEPRARRGWRGSAGRLSSSSRHGAHQRLRRSTRSSCLRVESWLIRVVIAVVVVAVNVVYFTPGLLPAEVPAARPRVPPRLPDLHLRLHGLHRLHQLRHRPQRLQGAGRRARSSRASAASRTRPTYPAPVVERVGELGFAIVDEADGQALLGGAEQPLAEVETPRWTATRRRTRRGHRAGRSAAILRIRSCRIVGLRGAGLGRPQRRLDPHPRRIDRRRLRLDLVWDAESPDDHRHHDGHGLHATSARQTSSPRTARAACRLAGQRRLRQLRRRVHRASIRGPFLYVHGLDVRVRDPLGRDDLRARAAPRAHLQRPADAGAGGSTGRRHPPVRIPGVHVGAAVPRHVQPEFGVINELFFFGADINWLRRPVARRRSRCCG